MPGSIRPLLLVMSVPVLLATVPCHVARAQAPAEPSAATIDAGRRIFHGKGTCFACHGGNLEGGPIAPPLKAHQWKDAKGGELSAILYVDTHGVSGTAMVSHPGGISDQEAAQVAAYIWAVSQGRAKP